MLAHDHGLHHVALLDGAARGGGLDAGDDHIADRPVAAERTAQHADAHDLFGAGVIGNLKSRLRLNHTGFPPL